MSDEHGPNNDPHKRPNRRYDDDDMDFSLEDVPASEQSQDAAAPAPADNVDDIDDDIFPPQDQPFATEAPSHRAAERTDRFPESPSNPTQDTESEDVVDDIDDDIFPPKDTSPARTDRFPKSPAEPEQPAEIDNKSEYVQQVSIPDEPPAKFLDYLKSRELWVSIAVLGIVGFGVLYLFFNILLPGITRQTDVVSVPRVVNLKYAEAKQKLEAAGLKVMVDSQYKPEMPPKTVLLQEPKQLSRVKPGRRVYLIINKVNPPEVKLPDIQDVHIDQATYLLENWGLKVGKMTYKPGRAKDIVKIAYHKDERIEPGDPILVGEQIDLIISRGLGNRKVPLADVIGMPLQEAVMMLKSRRLQHGQIRPIKVDSIPNGHVVRQYPKPSRVDSVLQGYQVDMWVNGTIEEIDELKRQVGINEEEGTQDSEAPTE